MGLIKSAKEAIGSTLHDQWKEAIRCEEMGNDILMVKKTTDTGVISNGSTIIVAPGQAAIIYDNGRILDATAEDGVYEFDSSSTPSLFAGQFGGMFKEMWERFTYDGASAKEQAVYFINLKEIKENLFGTPNPVPYKDWGHPIMNARTNSYIPMSVEIKCFGRYTFKICDPFKFMNFVAGVSDVYRKDELVEQMRAEVVGSFSNVMNGLGSDKHKIEVLELPNKTDEIKQIMDEEVFDQPIRQRGLQLVSFVVESLTLTDDSKEKIDKYELGGDAYNQQAVLTESYANAIENAASNKSGTVNGFMGIGMMNMATGQTFGSVNNAFEADKMKATAVNAKVDTWKCPKCGKEVSGKFCSECGAKKEETDAKEAKKCANCSKVLNENEKFCSECGTKVE